MAKFRSCLVYKLKYYFRRSDRRVRFHTSAYVIHIILVLLNCLSLKTYARPLESSGNMSTSCVVCNSGLASTILHFVLPPEKNVIHTC